MTCPGRDDHAASGRPARSGTRPHVLRRVAVPQSPGAKSPAARVALSPRTVGGDLLAITDSFGRRASSPPAIPVGSLECNTFGGKG
jgi:hypothetical protein